MIRQLSAAAIVLLSGGCEPADCEDGGRTYRTGDYWTCSDGCNNCGCDDGQIISTLIGCPTPPGPAAGKLKCQDDVWHMHGTSWSSPRGCVLTCDDGQLVGACADG